MQLAATAVTLLTLSLAATPLAARGCDGSGKPATPSPSGIGDGLWLVSREIRPGTYETQGSARCFWKRLGVETTHPGGGTRIIQQGRGMRQTVTIRKTDHAFETLGCGVWKRVP